LITINTPSDARGKASKKLHRTPPSRIALDEPRNLIFSIKDLLESSPEEELKTSTPYSQNRDQIPAETFSDSFSLSTPSSEGGSLTSSVEATFQDERWPTEVKELALQSNARYWQQRSVYLEGKVEMLKKTFAQNLKEFLTSHERLSRKQQSLLEKIHADNQMLSADLAKWKKITAQVIHQIF
jgi:hypothetical protein